MRVSWSGLAKSEFAEIRRFSVRRSGPAVATQYAANLRDAVAAAAAHPERLRVLRGPYRIVRVGSHYLIFHFDPSARRLTVARILHVRMDIERHLPPAGEDEG